MIASGNTGLFQITGVSPGNLLVHVVDIFLLEYRVSVVVLPMCILISHTVSQMCV